MLSRLLSWLSRLLSRGTSTPSTSASSGTPPSVPASSPASSGNPSSKESDFRRALDRVLQHEGGYVDHPHDPGGATRYGITERVARSHGYTGSMRELPLSVARDIYRADYWDAVGADRFPPALAFQLFDAAVNHGTGTAIRLLQRAVGVTDDGIAGPVTMRAVEAFDDAELVLRYNATRLEYYTSLSHWPTFGRGWSRRVAGNLRHAGEDL